MSQHYPRSTVSAAAYCNKCAKSTQHRIDDRRIGPCLECMARTEELRRSAPKEPDPRQGGLFDATAGAA